MVIIYGIAEYFFGKASVIIKEIKKFCPDIYQACV